MQEGLQFAYEEPNGFGLHLPAEVRLEIEDCPGAGTEGAVVEEDDVRVQVPVVGQRAFVYSAVIRHGVIVAVWRKEAGSDHRVCCGSGRGL